MSELGVGVERWLHVTLQCFLLSCIVIVLLPTLSIFLKRENLEYLSFFIHLLKILRCCKRKHPLPVHSSSLNLTLLSRTVEDRKKGIILNNNDNNYNNNNNNNNNSNDNNDSNYI